MTQTALNEATHSKDTLLNDMTNARHLSFNLESNKDELQRQIASLERERQALYDQKVDAQRQHLFAKQQLESEKIRYLELERVLTQERKNALDRQTLVQGLEQENSELKSEIKRLQSRLQSLQEYLENLSNSGANTADASHQQIIELNQRVKTKL